MKAKYQNIGKNNEQKAMGTMARGKTRNINREVLSPPEFEGIKIVSRNAEKSYQTQTLRHKKYKSNGAK